MFTTLRGFISDDLCDATGFLRTHHYMGRLSDSIPNLLAQTTGRSRDGSTVGGAALEYRFIYRKPARAGDLIVIKSGLKSVGAKTYCWCHWLFDADTGECFATAEAVAISLDLETRKAIDIPPEMRETLTRLVVPGVSV
jgi:acyl-CoA thioester hydrolase